MSRILVVDDEQVIRDLMREILERAGHETLGAESAAAAVALLDDYDVDVVVSDVVMPELTGLDLLDRVRAIRPRLPVILVTGAGTYETMTKAVARGADGLVMKPFSHAELQEAVASSLDRARRAELDVRERLLAPTLAAALANAIEARDPGLQGHCERLGALAARIAEHYGLTRDEIERVRLGAVLHDVGKIGIPDRVLLKDGEFSAEERALMRRHPEIGAELIGRIELLTGVGPIVRHHHERWDGSGYPDGLAGEDIPLDARIVAIADAVEAMSAPRTYRAEPLAADAVAQELTRCSGSQWDPKLVQVVVALIETGELAFDGAGLSVREGRAAAFEDPISVLLVHEDPDDAVATADAIEASRANVRVVHARDAETAAELCRSSRWSLAVVDEHLSGSSPLDLLTTIKERIPTLPVVMLASDGSEAVALEAFKRGVTDYVVTSDGRLSDLTERVRPLLEAA